MKFFIWKKFIVSFRHAFQGLYIVFWKEQSFRIQIIIALFVIFLMFYFPLLFLERAVLFLTIFFVLSLEIINSIFEKAVNVFEPAINTRVKKIKDMMAGSVLLASIGAIIVGFLVLWPYFKSLLY